MPQEKLTYRDNLDRLCERFPDREFLKGRHGLLRKVPEHSRQALSLQEGNRQQQSDTCPAAVSVVYGKEHSGAQEALYLSSGADSRKRSIHRRSDTRS